MAHLEAQFLPGMTWENQGKWHVDHIKPLASYDLTDPDEQKGAFHWLNLRPLWGLDNSAKGHRYDPADPMIVEASLLAPSGWLQAAA
jgi:hypothetical protein